MWISIFAIAIAMAIFLNVAAVMSRTLNHPRCEVNLSLITLLVRS